METKFNSAPAGTTAHQPFSRTDYRLNYTDLNDVDTAIGYANRLYATQEFPFLNDILLWALICSLVRVRMARLGVNAGTSNVPFQGWAERIMRAAGLVGMQMPQGSFFANWAFRLRVANICVVYLNEEVRKEHGL
jgi:hypothetical protein